MRGIGKSKSRFLKIHSILVMTLLQLAFVSQFSLVTSATRFQQINEQADLRGSIARYRHLMRHEFMRSLHQVVDNSKNTEEHSDIHVKIDEPEKSNDDRQVFEKNFEDPLKETVDGKEEEKRFEGTEGDAQEVDAKLNQKSTEENANEKQEKNFEEQIEVEKHADVVGEKDTQEPQMSTQNIDGESTQEQLQVEQITQGIDEKEEIEEITSDKQGEDNKVNEPGKAPEEKIEEEEPFVFPEPYFLGPTIKDWDEQRAGWFDENPHMRSTNQGKPRVLIISGSQPWPCRSPIGDNFHLKSLKNKIDYARMHNFEIYYNFVWLDPLFGGFWVKLPTVRQLMLTHPEIEWFLWLDSDAVFTDMLFEIPFDTYNGSNMIMWGMKELFINDKNWVAFNAGVFFLRNCQWSLDLIDKWSPMGPDPVRAGVGKMLSKFLGSRAENFPADDQSALAYLLLTDDAIMSKVKLVQDDYCISLWWVDAKDHYEEYMEKFHPGLGDIRWPFITHFTGCSPCNAHNNPDYSYEMCMENFNRAYNFADNQVLAYMGFQHVSLVSPDVIRTRNETAQPLENLNVNPWAARVDQVAATSS